ncbi:hypothetical protein [Nitrobacter winogradskyi]|uniref:hypothetical protein n=1 Tax=Nitrobacter winogradskyi TaxID=913 RepID=UPI0015E84E37|nr:hypothetical protein [Nitrobacter winogradskyi]
MTRQSEETAIWPTTIGGALSRFVPNADNTSDATDTIFRLASSVAQESADRWKRRPDRLGDTGVAVTERMKCEAVERTGFVLLREGVTPRALLKTPRSSSRCATGWAR